MKQGNIYLGDSLIAEYRFLKNYYFMAGDRVENSKRFPLLGVITGRIYCWKGCQDMEISG